MDLEDNSEEKAHRGESSVRRSSMQCELQSLLPACHREPEGIARHDAGQSQGSRSPHRYWNVSPLCSLQPATRQAFAIENRDAAKLGPMPGRGPIPSSRIEDQYPIASSALASGHVTVLGVEASVLSLKLGAMSSQP